MTRHPARLELVTSPDIGGAPPTPEELAWWRQTSKPERRRTLLLWVPWYAGLLVIPRIIRHPGPFFAHEWIRYVPLGLLFGFGMGMLMWRITSAKRFELRLAAKRIREALVAEP